jgi:hypothetical protein
MHLFVLLLKMNKKIVFVQTMAWAPCVLRYAGNSTTLCLQPEAFYTNDLLAKRRPSTYMQILPAHA